MSDREDAAVRRRAAARRGGRGRGFAGDVVAGVVFFCVLTPFALLLRLAGRDRLRLRLDRAAPSYWIARDRVPGPTDCRQTEMTRQS